MARQYVERTLEEEFASVGLSGKMIEEIERHTQLVEDSPMNPRPTGGKQASGMGGSPAGDRRELNEHEYRETLVNRGSGAAPAPGSSGPESQEEALKVMKKKRKTAGERLAAKIEYKKGRSEKKKASKMYRKTHKRAIKKRMAMKLRKFGGTAGLAKLHKQNKRAVMAGAEEELASLREGIENIGHDSDSNIYEDVAYHAGVYAFMVGEILEAMEAEQEAEAMYALSDRAADLSEAFEGIEELDEAQGERLEAVIQGVHKGMRAYEALGSPSLYEAAQYARMPRIGTRNKSDRFSDGGTDYGETMGQRYGYSSQNTSTGSPHPKVSGGAMGGTFSLPNRS